MISNFSYISYCKTIWTNRMYCVEKAWVHILVLKCICCANFCLSEKVTDEVDLFGIYLIRTWKTLLFLMLLLQYIKTLFQLISYTPIAGGRGFDPQTRHTKDFIKMVRDDFLLSARHKKIGRAPLFSQPCFKNEMDSTCTERSRVINISCDILLRILP